MAWETLPVSLSLFAAAAGLILFAGIRLTAIADELAYRTGLGGALFGGLFLGGTTSLSGTVTTITAAADGNPDMAIANSLGGIAAQTAFLGLADFAHRGTNLEHAAASAANLTHGMLLGLLLALPLVALSFPASSIWGIHPASLAIPVVYGFGLRLIARATDRPMWRPVPAAATRSQAAGSTMPGRKGMAAAWSRFALFALIVAGSGFVLAKAAQGIVVHTGLSQAAVGGLFTALSTSLPELVTVLAAVRRGALGLAVGDILGGNCFDVLMLTAADIGYRTGAIYTVWSGHHTFLVAVTLVMTSILLLGLLHREKHGPANIGIESVLVLTVYLATAARLLAG